MIKANELRIGNVLKHKSGEHFKVTGSDLAIMDLKDDLSAILPVPLSEEILLKCGFEIKPFSTGLTLDRFRFIWKPEYKYWYVLDAYSHSYLTKIEFVHELQNFVFVMDGQELNTSGL